MISQKPEHLFDKRESTPARRNESETHKRFGDRLDRILEDATRVIAQVGYEKASMRTVAKAAGVSLSGMYHYFESKERMLFLIEFRCFNSLLNNLREKLHGLEDPVEQLRVMVRTQVEYFAANMAALKVCSHELDSLTGAAYEETREIRRTYYTLTRSVIERLLHTRNAGSAPDSHVATMCLFGTLNWLYRWYDPKSGPSPAVLANQISEQFLCGVLGGVPGQGDSTSTKHP